MKYDLEEIVDKYVKGDCTPEELEEVLKLFEDPYHNLALRPALHEQWLKQGVDKSFKLQEKDKIYLLKKIHRSIHRSSKKNLQERNFSIIETILKFAAILLIGILLGGIIQRFGLTEPVYITSIAPKGSISQMVLPDNTIVFLNSGSEIKYTASSKNGIRNVYLNGEAWFEVKKNKRKPFVVHTPFYSIKVLGTQFNVKAYEADKEIVTTLEEGSIEVFCESNMKMAPQSLLKPGQQLVYNQERKTFYTTTVRPHLFTSWKENKLIFINMNLKELIVLLERKYGVDIEVSDDTILDYHYDGTIENESIIEMLNLLKETLPIIYHIEGQRVIIENKQK